MKTFHTDFHKGIYYYRKLNPGASEESFVVYTGDEHFLENNTKVLNYKNVAQINETSAS